MPSKICIKEGCNNPRKISKSGNMLTMCEDCQRKDWRNRKRDENGYQPRKKGNWSTIKSDNTSETSRKCKQCKKRKPIEAFGMYGKNRKRTCKACEGLSESKVKPPKGGKHVLFVAGDTLVLAQVISQSQVKNKAL